ncbi:hypothetical protein [Edaphobacter aggregans]|uniref:hypothetical protein n=1 Tax=Edaphobacter aggregans TaxID=570835 RepID=UPI00068BB154|nr:hypothetical protein [Edaphobacter aggregans]
MKNFLRPVLCRAAAVISAVLFLAVHLTAQTPSVAPAKPRLPLLGVPSNIPVPDPTTPAASAFHDQRYGVSFKVPAGWTLTRHDAEVSTFAFDVRTAPMSGIMRGVATIAFNPHPTSTFSGALFYFSVTPRTTEALCRTQASAQAPRSVTTAQIAGTPFTHGYDEHGTICTEARDEIYTAYRNSSCYRFDLVINTFCGGDVSGVRDITPAELNAVRHRLESILSTVTFDTK